MLQINQYQCTYKQCILQYEIQAKLVTFVSV